jgi:serine/threonine-protein kinase HipA
VAPLAASIHHPLSTRAIFGEAERIYQKLPSFIADSYEKLFAVCRKLHLPEVDCQELFRRMVFNILANNTDDHHKNFTFIMDRQGRWRLSPAYDMTYIFDSGSYLPNKEHCLMIGGKYQDITLDDIISFASENGIRAPKSIINKVATAVSTFRSLAKKNGVSDEWTGRVETTIIDHLKAWGEWNEENNTALFLQVIKE